jgi:putative PIN family toxin of toxin-antitoxin system
MPNQIVVFDTNVLIPMLLSASRSTRLFYRIDAIGWELAATPQLLAEVADKLRTKESLRKWLDVSDGDIEEFIDVRLANMVTMKPGVRQAHGVVSADPTDDMVIAAALEAKAAYLISEDKHLLDLGQYQSITIMNREQFEVELDRLGVAE